MWGRTPPITYGAGARPRDECGVIASYEAGRSSVVGSSITSSQGLVETCWIGGSTNGQRHPHSVQQAAHGRQGTLVYRASACRWAARGRWTIHEEVPGVARAAHGRE